MGQVNECCNISFPDAKFDINEVRIHWPQAAEEILALRQANCDIKLQSHSNIPKQQISQKVHQRIYKEFITQEYCFFGYVTTQKTTEQHQLCQTQSQQLVSKQIKKRRTSKKQKQNNLQLDFLLTSHRLNDFGILIHRDKACYKGNFRNNKYHGKGYLSSLISDETFQGLFEYGLKASGTYETKEIKYIGQFKNDQMEGNGILRFKKTQQLYEGQMMNGKMHGKGKITYPSGQCYQGCFQNGLYHGEGTYIWSNGDKFKGTYKKGIKHGFGILTLNGTSHQLCWVNGIAEGQPASFQEYKSKKQIQLSRKTIKTQKNINEE